MMTGPNQVRAGGAELEKAFKMSIFTVRIINLVAVHKLHLQCLLSLYIMRSWRRKASAT